ncbi:hypothetical protein ANCCAN_26227 [Ancylostoma caninum]|uniref:Uncharacterized protein n=1 Tax=Ancylostoma caninum TaxID=29170 RepID=A0A368FB36_ANCCA|nr:hypothetical protein ANCCAN_26227 [Ancylostoma caninum]
MQRRRAFAVKSHFDIAVILGRKEDEAFPMLIKAVGIEDEITPKEYIAQFDAIVAGMVLGCKAMPGAEKLVRHFSRKGVGLFSRTSTANLSRMDIAVKVCQQQYALGLGERHLGESRSLIKNGWIS